MKELSVAKRLRVSDNGNTEFYESCIFEKQHTLSSKVLDIFPLAILQILAKTVVQIISFKNQFSNCTGFKTGFLTNMYNSKTGFNIKFTLQKNVT